MNQPEIMTVQEVAELLRVSERTVYDWATNGQIPCGKLGTSWRFKRSEIENWIDTNLTPRKRTDPAPIISLRDILSPEHVLVFDTTSKRQALQYLIDVVSTSPLVGRKAEVQEGIFYREELMSTGIGLGIAVPHVRLVCVKNPLMAVGISTSDITDYESIDGKPVRLLFMILAGSHQHAEHIRILAQISGLVKDDGFRNALMQAQDAEYAYDLLIRKAN